MKSLYPFRVVILVTEFLDNALVRIVLTLVGAVVLGELVPKLFYKLDERSDRINLSSGAHAAFKKLFGFAVWLAALVLIVEFSGYTQYAMQLLAGESLQDKAVKIIFAWAVILVFVKYVSGAFKQLDDIVTEIDFSTHTHQLVQKALNYTAYAIGIVLTISIMGWDAGFTALLTGAGVAGIVIGFAAKDVFSNLLSGIFLILDQPFKIGDSIEINGTTIKGVVKEISLRSTALNTEAGTVIYVPNQLMATNAINNVSRKARGHGKPKEQQPNS